MLPGPYSGCGVYVGLGWGWVGLGIPVLLGTSRIEGTGPIVNPVQPGQTALRKPRRGPWGLSPLVGGNRVLGLRTQPGGDRF